MQAIVKLTEADNVADFKKAIEGRIQAVANVNNLFVEMRWAALSSVASSLKSLHHTEKAAVNVSVLKGLNFYLNQTWHKPLPGCS